MYHMELPPVHLYDAAVTRKIIVCGDDDHAWLKIFYRFFYKSGIAKMMEKSFSRSAPVVVGCVVCRQAQLLTDQDHNPTTVNTELASTLVSELGTQPVTSGLYNLTARQDS